MASPAPAAPPRSAPLPAPPGETETSRRLRRIALLVGLGIGVLMVARGQVGGDQLNLLARGWLVVARGEWVHFGNPLSSGGNAPGTITTALVAAPLAVWRDARAPGAFALLLHLAGYLLLDRLVGRLAGGPARLVFAVVYWLNPWQLYFTGFVWNPNFLFPLGAIHLWTTWRQRLEPHFGHSFLHVAALGVAAQIHPSVLLLIVASALLWWRGLWRVHWPGAIAGAAATLLTLVPWVLAVRTQPAIATASEGYLLRGLVTVFPLLKGVVYWLRYGSLHLSDKINVLDFSSVAGPVLAARLEAAGRILRLLGPLTLLLPLAANLRFWRGRTRRLLGAATPSLSPRAWLRRYVAWCFVAALVVFALSPTTLQMWQALVLLHAAVLPLVLWWTALLRTRRRRAAAAGLAAWGALQVAALLALALASPFYRPGGPAGVHIALRADSPMLRDLAIVPRVPITVRVENGWWPDVLPEE